MTERRVPVALFVYNRPETTARAMAAIASARPASLVVVADGPADADDEARTAAARTATERIDWPCRVERVYADAHLGIKARFESGMRAIFERYDAAIVLEDDCIPHPAFFAYCESLLDRYRDHERVMSIGGSRLTRTAPAHDTSYAFCRYPLIWGWATWRRAWRRYDGEMRDWPRLRDGGWLESVLGARSAALYWAHVFERNWREGVAGNWDYAWVFSCWRSGGLSVVPAKNLVSNIGFGTGGTHTTDARSPFNALPADPLRLPLVHPVSVAGDANENAAIEREVFGGNLDRAMNEVRRRVRERRAGPAPDEADARA